MFNLRRYAQVQGRRLLPVCALLAGLGCVLRGEDVLHIAEADAKKAAITAVMPEYPAMAKQMRVSGVVVVEAEVDTEGKVGAAHPVRGNALLGAAAAKALEKWKFTPFTSEGKPVKAVVVLSFNFVL